MLYAHSLVAGRRPANIHIARETRLDELMHYYIQISNLKAEFRRKSSAKKAKCQHQIPTLAVQLYEPQLFVLSSTSDILFSTKPTLSLKKRFTDKS